MTGWVEKAAPGVSSAKLKLSLGTAIALFLVFHCWRGVWFLVRQWPLWLAGGLTLVAVQVYDGLGAYGLSAAGAGVAAALVVWALLHRRSFEVCVYWPLRGWVRGLFVYAPGWDELMAVCGLAKKVRSEHRAPRLIRTRSTNTVDRVRVKTLRGQTLADFADNTDRFRENTGAEDCRVRRLYWPGLTIAGRQLIRRRLRARVLDLWFLVRDPLANPVPLFAVDDRPNLKKLTLALREDGLPWALRLLGTHVLVAGRTGAGKGSVLWSLIRSLGPAIRDGSVELWMVDPKGGMEFAAGQALCARYCYGDRSTDDEGKKRAYQLDFAEFLEDAVDTMQHRQRELRGISRTHKARPGDPHIVIMIDELACLTAYVTDREAKKRIDVALGMLLSQGRAVGISVVAALQDARKEVLPDRGLFPTRIALGLNEPDETDLVLGSVARKNGARCDEISEDTPGVAFVAVEDTREPIRVRFAYVDDDEIGRLTQTHRHQPMPVDPYPAEPLEETNR
ncbi:MAG: cell division protein FtsK [Streptosporangiales bacterium]|nr:cell division protein FtsK [Streptosporangiales bacterium]